MGDDGPPAVRQEGNDLLAKLGQLLSHEGHHRIRRSGAAHESAPKPGGVIVVGAGLRWQRHTCATLLLASRVNPKVVSEMLGHATVAITLDIYSHVLPDMQHDAAATLEHVLYG